MELSSEQSGDVHWSHVGLGGNAMSHLQENTKTEGERPLKIVLIALCFLYLDYLDVTVTVCPNHRLGVHCCWGKCNPCEGSVVIILLQR